MKTASVGDRPSEGFRDLLQRELASRCAVNPQYSLRAFARSLKIDHSTLSQILRRKRRLTADVIRALAQAIGLPADDVDRFVACEDQVAGQAASDRHERQLHAEALEVITQGHHFAILELTRLESFRPDSRWIARVLDLSVQDVNLAITRLLHLGLLRMASRTTWIDTSEHAFAQLQNLPAVMVRDLTARIARLAIAGNERDHVVSSTTVAINRRRLPHVAAYLERVRCELSRLLQDESASPDDVFQLDILLYPLTRLHQERDHGPPRDTVSDPRQESADGR